MFEVKKFLLFLSIVLVTFLGFSKSAFAQSQENFIIDAVTTIVGLGSDDEEEKPNPGPDLGPAPDCGSIDQRLKDDFGVIVKEGGSGWPDNYAPAENVGCAARQGIYKAYRIPSASSRFIKLLEPGDKFSIECYNNSSVLGAAGRVYDSQVIKFSNCSKIATSTFTPYAFLYLHETGHLMKQRHYRLLQQEFPRTRLMREDPNCFASEGIIKTYNRRGLSSYSLISESSAEAMALYVYNKKDGDYANINNFKNECPSIYKWAKDNVYGGYEFN